MNPNIAHNFCDDSHQVNPARSSRPSRLPSCRSGGIDHAGGDLTRSAIRLPIVLGVDCIHGHNWSTLAASRPFIVLAPKVGDADFHDPARTTFIANKLGFPDLESKPRRLN